MHEQPPGYQSGPLPPTPEPTPEPDPPIEVPPLARSRAGRAVLVLSSGVLTSALALFGVFALNYYGNENIMGLYANLVIPAGAILVGLVASSGYALVAWLSGLKMRTGLIIPILFLQVGSYFASQYVEFWVTGPYRLPNGHTIGFLEYYDVATRSFAWKEKSGGGAGQPLNGWGYLIRIGEILGFTLGAIIIPAAMSSMPYCRYCERYMKQREIVTMPPDDQLSERLKRSVQTGDRPGFIAQVQEHRKTQKVAKKLPQRIVITLTRCTSCDSGTLAYKLLRGSGNQIHVTDLGSDLLDPTFVRALVEAKLA